MKVDLIQSKLDFLRGKYTVLPVADFFKKEITLAEERDLKWLIGYAPLLNEQDFLEHVIGNFGRKGFWNAARLIKFWLDKMEEQEA